jgi:hypothetical protein
MMLQDRHKMQHIMSSKQQEQETQGLDLWTAQLNKTISASTYISSLHTSISKQQFRKGAFHHTRCEQTSTAN